MLLLDSHHRWGAVRLRRQRPKDGAIPGGWWRTGARRNRSVENDGRRGVAGRVTNRQSKLIGGACVSKEADSPHRRTSRRLVGGLCDPRAERGAAGADFDGDILDSGESVVPGPVKVQGTPLRRIRPPRRAWRVDVI